MSQLANNTSDVNPLLAFALSLAAWGLMAIISISMGV